MRCSDERCTGVHSHKRSWAELCPTSKERHLAYKRGNERELARKREWYANLTGYEYNRLLLVRRRRKALKRMAERERRRVGSLPGEG